MTNSPVDSSSSRIQLHFLSSANALSRKPCREEYTHCQKVDVLAEVRKVRGVAAIATDHWDPAVLRMDHLNDQDMGPILQEGETGQHPDIADYSPIYKGYWTQWKSVTVRDGILEQHWSPPRDAAQIVLPQCKVKEVLAKLYGELSGEHLGVNKTLDKVRQRYY